MSKKRARISFSSASVSSRAHAALSSNPLLPKHSLAISLMAVFVLMAYANTFHVPFQFDDAPNIVENLSVHLQSLSLKWLDQLIEHNSDSIRFFAYFTFALNYYFGGLQVFGYHLVNLLIHLSCGLLVYGFLLLTLNLPSLRERYGSIAFPIALFTSLLFLAHPVQTQSVTYIVQRMTSLGGMFYLLALVLYVKGRLSSGNRRGLFWTAAGLSYLLGLFTKENVAILPLFVALYEFYFFQNLDLGPRGRKALCYSVGLVLLIGLLMAVVWGKRYIDVIIEGYQMRDFSLTERVLTQFRVVLYYVTLLVYPVPSRLNLDYDFPTSHGIFDPPTTLLSILIVCGLIGYGLWSARKRPLVSYFILWYFGNLVIESSFFPLEMVYEHRLYLPAIGPMVLFTVLVVKEWEKIKDRLRLRLRSREDTVSSGGGDGLSGPGADRVWRGKDYPLWGLLLVVVVVLVWGTHERNKTWRDPITLWQDCIRKSPRKERPHYNLGFQYSLVGRYPESIEAFKEAIRLRPNDPDCYNSLGLVYKTVGAYPEAIAAYQEAIRIRPGFARAMNNLGVAYSETGLHHEAIDLLRRADDLRPDDAEIKNNLGVAYRRAERYQEAIRTYSEALRLSPNDPEICSNLGDTYYHLGQFHEATQAFRQATRLKPRSGLFHYNLGVACVGLGDHEAAIDAYLRALEIEPGHVQARFNLALSYLMLKRRDLALGQYQILKDINRDQADRLLALIRAN